MSPASRRSSGVSVRRTSLTRAKAEMMSDRGAVTWRRSPASSHTVFMDMESLPTGMAMPRAGQSSMPTARTVS